MLDGFGTALHSPSQPPRLHDRRLFGNGRSAEIRHYGELRCRRNDGGSFRACQRLSFLQGCGEEALAAVRLLEAFQCVNPHILPNQMD
jgi:hypothetical protein